MRKGFHFVALMQIITTLLIASGCVSSGGGDAPAPEPIATYPLTGDPLYQYATGDRLTYDFSQTVIYDTGERVTSSGVAVNDFIADSYVGTTPFWLAVGPLSKRLVTITVGGVDTVDQDFYSYNQSGDFVRYLTSPTNYYTNQAAPETGSLTVSSNLFVGSSWSSSNYIVGESVYHYDTIESFTVVGTEMVSVPFGNVECFKIVISGFGDSLPTGTFLSSTISYSGSAWVNPSIGIVKSAMTYDESGVTSAGVLFVNRLKAASFSANLTTQ